MNPAIAILLPIAQEFATRVVGPFLLNLATSKALPPEEAVEKVDAKIDTIAKELAEELASDPAFKPKNILTSRTFWLGLAGAIGTPALLYLQGIDWYQHAPVYVAVVVTNLLAIALRFVTTKPATLY